MAVPSIVWRNPNYVPRRRAWDRAKHDASRSLYVVVESAPDDQRKWTGLPNLEIIQGGALAPARKTLQSQRLPSGTWEQPSVFSYQPSEKTLLS